MNFISKQKKENERVTKILLNTLEAQNFTLTSMENNSKLLNESFLKMAKAILEQNAILKEVVHTVTDYFSIQTELLKKEAKEYKEPTEADGRY